MPFLYPVGGNQGTSPERDGELGAAGPGILWAEASLQLPSRNERISVSSGRVSKLHINSGLRQYCRRQMFPAGWP